MNCFTKFFSKCVNQEIYQLLRDYRLQSIAKQVETKIYLPEKKVSAYKDFITLEKDAFFSRNLFCQQFEKFYMKEKYEVLVSYFTLSGLQEENRDEFLKNIQRIAPKTIFIDFQMPERNHAHFAYNGLTKSEKIKLCWETLGFSKDKREKIMTNYKKFLENGGIEGYLYNISENSEIKPKKIDRRYIKSGGLGIYYCEWE